METPLVVAWFGAIVSVLGGAFAVIKGVTAWVIEKREERNQARMLLRQQALLEALEVIDHVWANTEGFLPGGRKAAEHVWDIGKAWRATNLMILYCKDASRALKAFYAAMGEPDRKPFGTAELDAFRKVVAEELELPASIFTDWDPGWIAELPGAAAASQVQAQRAEWSLPLPQDTKSGTNPT
jgi:hypothetical protein